MPRILKSFLAGALLFLLIALNFDQRTATPILLRISCKDPKAIDAFNEGYLQLYAYHFLAAEHFFSSALKNEPECSIATWGLWEARKKQCLETASEIDESTERQLEAALSNSQNSYSWEIDLIESAIESKRPTTRASQIAYAESLNNRYQVSQEVSPNDIEVEWLSLASDALYFASGLTDSGRKPSAVHCCNSSFEAKSKKPSKIVTDLEYLLNKGLKKAPTHPGLLHTFIHVYEQDMNQKNILNQAKSLDRQNQGRIGHFAHMPAHIYWRRGLMREAILANENAIRIDENEFLKFPEFKSSYYYPYHYLHYHHFLANIYILQGEADKALEASRFIVENFNPKTLNFSPELRDDLLCLQQNIQVRFGRYHDFIQQENTYSSKGGKKAKLMRSFLRAVSMHELNRKDDFLIARQPLDQNKKETNEFSFVALAVAHLDALVDEQNGVDLDLIKGKLQSEELMAIEAKLRRLNPNNWFFWSAVLLYRFASQRRDQMELDFQAAIHKSNFPSATLFYGE